jgi:hypothetical protein
MVWPIALFDKSFLQGLNPLEALMYDSLFVSNITPVFWVEVLGDLEKEHKGKEAQEKLVATLSSKTPKHHPFMNINHHLLCVGELLGQPVEMTNKPLIYSGKEINMNGDKHLYFDVAPELMLFEKWSNNFFSEEERRVAKSYRDNLKAITKINQPVIDVKPNQKFRTVVEVKGFTDAIIYSHDSRLKLVKAALNFFNITPKHKVEIIDRWKKTGGLPFSEFAPYCAYVMSVTFFFQVAVLNNLLSQERKSNWIDLAYLYYFPFTQVFISADRLHEKIAPLFIKDSKQLFLKAEGLKKDLKKLVNYYYGNHPEIDSVNLGQLPEYPPLEGSFLTSDIYDKIRPGWCQFAKNPIEITPELNEEIMHQFNPILETIKENISKGWFKEAENNEKFKTVTHVRRVFKKLEKKELVNHTN